MSMTREQANDIFTPESEDKFAEQIKQLDHGTLTEAYQALNDGTYPTEKEEKIRGALLMEAADRIKALASGGFNDDELDGVSAFVAEFGNDEQKAVIGNLVEKRRSDLADAAFLDNIDAHDRGGQAFAADMNRRLTPWNGDNEYNTFLVDTVEAKRFIDAHYEEMPEGLKERTDAWLKESQDFVDVTDDQINKFAAKENEHGVLRYFDTFGRGKDGEYTAEATEFLEKVNAVRAANGVELLVLRDGALSDEEKETDYLDSLDPLGPELAEYKREAEVQDYLVGLAAEGSRQAMAFKNMVEGNMPDDLTAGELLQHQVDVRAWIDQDLPNMPASIQENANEFVAQVGQSLDNLAPEFIKEAANDANEEVALAFANAFGPKGQEFLGKVNAEREAAGAKPFSAEHAAEQKYLRELPEDNNEAQAFKDVVQRVSQPDGIVERMERYTGMKKWFDEHEEEIPESLDVKAGLLVRGVYMMMEGHPLSAEDLKELAKDENQAVVQAFAKAYPDGEVEGFTNEWAAQIKAERVKEGLEDSELRQEVKAYLAKIDDNQKDNNEAEDEAWKNTDLGAKAYKGYVMAQLDAAEKDTEVDLSKVDLVAAYHYMAHRKQEDKEGMPAKVSEFEGKFEEEAKKAIKDKTLSLDYGVSDNIYETAKFAGFMAKYDTLGADRQPSQEAKEILQAVEVKRENMGEISLKESEFLAGTSSEELKKRDEAINNLLESDDMKNMLEGEEFKNLNTFYEHVEVEGMEDLPQAIDKGALRAEKVTGLFGGKEEGEESEEKPEEEKKKRIQRGSDLEKDVYELAKAQAARELMQDSSFFEADEAERKRRMKLAIAEKMQATTLSMLANQYAQGVLGEGAYRHTSAQEKKNYFHKMADGQYVGQYAVQAAAMFGRVVDDPNAAGTVRLSEMTVATSLAADVASVEKFAGRLKQKIGENKLVQRVKAIDKRFTEKYPTLYPIAKKMATRFAIGQLTGPVGVAIYTARETLKARKKLLDRFHQQKENGGEQSLGKYLLHHKCEALGVAASAVGAGIAAWTGIDAINSDSIEAGLGAAGHWISNIMGHGADQAASAASNLAEGASLVDKIKDLPANTWDSVSQMGTNAWEGLKNAGSAIGTMASDAAHGNFGEAWEHVHNLTGKQVASLARASMGFAAGFGAASESFAKGNWKQGWKQFAGAFAGAAAAAIALENQYGGPDLAQEATTPAPEAAPTVEEYVMGGGVPQAETPDITSPEVDAALHRPIPQVPHDYGQQSGGADGGADGDGDGGAGGQGGEEQAHEDQQGQQQQQGQHNDEVVHEDEVKIPPSLLPKGAHIRDMQEVYSKEDGEINSGIKIYNGANGICAVHYQTDPETGNIIRTGTVSSIDEGTGLRYDVKVVQVVDSDGKLVSQEERMMSEDEAKEFRQSIRSADKRYSEDGVNKDEKALYKRLKNAPTADEYNQALHGRNDAHTIINAQDTNGQAAHIIQGKDGFEGEVTYGGKTIKFSIIQDEDKKVHYNIVDENGQERPMTPQERLNYKQAIENTGDHDAAKMLKKFGKREVYDETVPGQENQGNAAAEAAQNVGGIVGELKGEGSALQFQDGGANYEVGLTPQGMTMYSKMVDGQSIAMSDEEVHRINGEMLAKAKADLEASPDDPQAAAKVALAQNIIASQGMEDHAVGELNLDQHSMKISLSNDGRAIVAVSNDGAALRVSGTNETQVIRVEGEQAKAYIYNSETKTETPMPAEAQQQALQTMRGAYQNAGMSDTPAAKAINNTLSSQQTNVQTAAPVTRGGGYEMA